MGQLEYSYRLQLMNMYKEYNQWGVEGREDVEGIINVTTHICIKNTPGSLLGSSINLQHKAGEYEEGK